MRFGAACAGGSAAAAAAAAAVAACCSSVAFYFLLHCFFYFWGSSMSSTLQLLHFVLYSLLLAWGLCLSLGCVSYFAAAFFVKTVYSRIKVG